MLTWTVDAEIEKRLEMLGASTETHKKDILRKAVLEMLAPAPPAPAPKRESGFGCMKGTLEILGDIVEPLHDAWEPR